MGYKSDIEIAQECEMLPITQIAEKAGIDDKYLEQYGKYKAKIDYNLLKESDKKDGKLILVTAINPTPAGEGKTTTTVGLADGMQKLGKSVMVALREPSLGTVFGVKGGAAGGGYAQVVPMEDINLHRKSIPDAVDIAGLKLHIFRIPGNRLCLIFQTQTFCNFLCQLQVKSGVLAVIAYKSHRREILIKTNNQSAAVGCLRLFCGGFLCLALSRLCVCCGCLCCAVAAATCGHGKCHYCSQRCAHKSLFHNWCPPHFQTVEAVLPLPVSVSLFNMLPY